jgi:hypothetical protein
MIELIQALSRFSATASNAEITGQLLAVLCLAGLVISLALASNGVDLTPNFSNRRKTEAVAARRPIMIEPPVSFALGNPL